ncbi:AhpC/TSA family protein [Flavobacteriaceae bacterium S0825]|uniref:TlpA disulfide reductase family protein n=1 Tax=Gaetbulibacter sp. S0825 TaxID=2720084 RepID=UPI00142FE30B|nr:TlpA disulfide reductase family protein [Gaetbulibacter sp. S0825]MCK0108579.1 AhpC/TSA family protein [Flavobacteriaceae bacterium S0825]NIX64215.1 AhpC/TSA family protein [Gaetbulibacter sp. S0825]
MIKNFIKLGVAFFTIAFFQTCKEEIKVPADSFTVSGTIEGLDTEYMSRSYRDAEGNRVSDSIFVENGSFSYTAKIDQPTFIFFWPNVESTMKRTETGYYPVKSSQLAFLASPGDHIVFNGKVTDYINAYPSGTKANEDLASINSKVFPLMNTSINYLLEKGKLEKNDPRQSVLEDSIKHLDEKVVALKKEFVLSNPNSEAAVWYLSDMMLRNQVSDYDAVTAYNAFSDNLKTYPFYKAVTKRVAGIKSTKIGNTVANFSTNNTFTGDSFEFNSLRGKYVLIDFWGTWCGPCIAEMPKVKEYQEKYKDKLVVLGVNQGDTKEQVEKFITPNNYTWTHLMNGNGDDDFVLKFNVAGFPTKFIIDPEGKILYRFVGDSEESFTVLDGLLE